MARSDLSFTRYLREAAGGQSDTAVTSPATWTCADEGVYVRVGVLLFLHQRHFVDDRVGVVQLIWNQEATQHDNMCTVVAVGRCVGVCVCVRMCVTQIDLVFIFPQSFIRGS